LPDLAGLDFQAARAKVRELKLGWLLVFEGTENDPTVRATEPAATATVSKGITIKIFVKGSAPLATVPDVKGLDCPQAADLIVDHGLYPQYPSGRSGVVLTQTPTASDPQTLHWNDQVELACGQASYVDKGMLAGRGRGREPGQRRERRMAEDGSRRDGEAPGPYPQPVEPSDPAETREQPNPDETAQQPAAADSANGDSPTAAEDSTDMGPSGTSVLPAIPEAKPGPPRWSARAQVRPPDIDHGAGVQADWDEAAERLPRGLFVPVLVTATVVLLLALIGLGVWLVLHNRSTTPGVPPSNVVTSSPGTPTTKPPATRTTAPPTTVPALVPIPDLRGKDYGTAAAELTALGFVPSRSDESDPELPAGQVIGTDPPAGNQLLPGTKITVRVSTGPAVVPTTEPPTTPPPT